MLFLPSKVIQKQPACDLKCCGVLDRLLALVTFHGTVKIMYVVHGTQYHILPWWSFLMAHELNCEVF